MRILAIGDIVGERAVREYRAEAEQMAAAGQKTPQQAGQGVAEDFVWTGI